MANFDYENQHWWSGKEVVEKKKIYLDSLFLLCQIN